MTKKQKDKICSTGTPLNVSCQQISKSDLANFLKRLAALYKSPTTGNPALSVALEELATMVSSQRPSITKAANDSGQKLQSKLPLDITEIKAFDSKAIYEFIKDEKKTKNELIELAAVRFSIPRSQLKRSKTSEVRETIKSACLHEDSIRIIAEDARSEGLQRSS